MKHESIYIYGRHAVAAAMARRGDTIERVYFAHEFDGEELRSAAKGLHVPIESFSEKRMPGGVSKTATHQGVVAAIAKEKLVVPYRSFSEELAVHPETALVLLGEVQDPHNVGAVIRAAAAFGLAGVLMPPHNQAPVTGTVVKVSSGMAFSVPLVEISNVNATITDLQKRGFWTYGLADEKGAQSLYEEEFSKPSVFVLGNEASGLRLKTGETCDTLLSIPLHPQAESLNASAAAATVFSHWSKQHLGALRSA